MSNFLFDDFEAVTSKQWKQKIQAELRGADYNETLIWKNNEGIDVKPFYHPDAFEGLFSPVPGQPKTWSICQKVFIDDVLIARKLAKDALSRGAESIWFVAEKKFVIATLFQDLPVDGITFYIELDFLGKAFISEINNFSQANNTHINILTDAVGRLAEEGNWYNNFTTDFEIYKQLTTAENTNFLSVDLSIYQNAGATMTQQLAYGLAHVNEYLNALFANENISKTLKEQWQPIFKVAIGSNYFFEISKLRALRKLYATLAKAYGLNENCKILAFPSKRNKTIYDYNVNMLRTTTECMSAVLGSADVVCNTPYDALYHKSNEFGERISRNQLLVLKNESYFDMIANAADGTYYIESITLQLSEKALQLFKDIEAAGGFLKQLKEGTIQKKIKESAAKEQEQFDKGEKVLLGTNKHPNKNDRLKDDLELFPFVKTNPRKTLIEPIIARRLAEKTEQDRLKDE
ncbi:MAG TPA: methylmalonyl-CoA mutase subunit beta [Flavobacteriaceae bacterium]|nr:methylmalonyl-CoA mutase subunit beta [Flavobacteriaceae bacterium]